MGESARAAARVRSLGHVHAPGHSPAAAYLATLSEGSRRTMRQALEVISDILESRQGALAYPWGKLRYRHVAIVRARLGACYSPATANKMLCALRGVLREAWRLGLIPEAEYRLALDIKRIPGSALPAGRALSAKEIDRLLWACAADRTEHGVRDAAVIAVLYACGLRRSELSHLDLADFDSNSTRLRVRRGKGAKDRLVPVAEGATALVGKWLAVRGDMPGPLFLRLQGSRCEPIVRLSCEAIYNILRKRARQACVAPLSPHDLRRTLITHLLSAGVDLVTVSRIAGHASVATTSKYDKRGDEAMRDAVSVILVPSSSSFGLAKKTSGEQI